MQIDLVFYGVTSLDRDTHSDHITYSVRVEIDIWRGLRACSLLLSIFVVSVLDLGEVCL